MNIIVSNRTNKNKTKQKRLQQEYILPSHNIKYPDETIPFLRGLLNLHKTGVDLKSILFSASKELLNKELDEYKHYDTGVKIDIPEQVKKEKDLIGSIYQYLTPKDIRLSKGSFYTNEVMIEDIVSQLDIKETDTVLDPAVGSGNLLFNSKVTKPEQIIGVDFDELAIFCCKVNYYLKFGNDAPAPKLYCDDFCHFITQNKEEFDYVLCNPPYGATLDVSLLSNLNMETEDSLTYFVVYTSLLARKKSIFILPESVINVKKHTDLRKWILDNNYLTAIKSYGANFSGTMFPIVTLTLDKNNQNDIFNYDGENVKISIIKEIPFYYFRPMSEENENLIKKVFAKNAQSLKGSIFALGVVTGDNKTKVFTEQQPGYEPVITGKDIFKYRILPPSKYIVYDRSNLQQVAPDELYRSPEKIIYKTVSRNMIFALDNTRTLTLNSANFFIPQGLTISNKCILALFNSSLYDRLNKLLYGENKISRTNLENLPIPDIDLDTQHEIEHLVDNEEYEKIEEIVNKIFNL